jgi:hypothetical protein
MKAAVRSGGLVSLLPGSFVGSVLGALLLAAPLAAWTAEPVFVTQGDARGQAHTFVLGQTCYAYSAAHLFRSKGAAVALVDKDGFRADAKVIGADQSLDLALLEVAGGVTANRQLCRAGGTMTMLDTARALPELQRQATSFWVDHVTAEAGGLARLKLGLARKSAVVSDVILMVPLGQRAGAPGSSIGDGFSGASVWAGPARADRQRFREGDDPARARGKLLGVLVGSSAGVVDVVPAEVLHEFIFGTLQPVRWKDLRLTPANARFVHQRRGRFLPPAQMTELPLGNAALDRLAFEIEVHDVDTLLEGVTLHFDPRQAPVRGSSARRSIQVETSDVAPATTKRWQRESCVADRRRVERGSPAPNTMTCTIRDRRLVRGVRLELAGDTAGLRAIELAVER